MGLQMKVWQTSNSHVHQRLTYELTHNIYAPWHSNHTRLIWGLMLKRWWLRWLRTMR